MNTFNNLSSGQPGLQAQLPVQPVPMWIAVHQRFEQFHQNLGLTLAQQVDGITKRNGVVSCLNRNYYGAPSDTEHSFLIGSWGKDTATRPPRDVDLYFLLPPLFTSGLRAIFGTGNPPFSRKSKAFSLRPIRTLK